MKATIDIPETIYRQVKAKAALEGRAIREVTIELFRGWVGEEALVVGSSSFPSAAQKRPQAPRRGKAAGAPAASPTPPAPKDAEDALDQLATKLL